MITNYAAALSSAGAFLVIIAAIASEKGSKLSRESSPFLAAIGFSISTIAIACLIASKF